MTAGYFVVCAVGNGALLISVGSVLQPLSLGFPAGEPMPVDFVRAVAKSVVEVGDLDDPLTRERHDRFCGKCNNHSSSTHVLHRLQRQANEVRPYGRWDKSLRSFHAADGGSGASSRRTLQVCCNKIVQILLFQLFLAANAFIRSVGAGSGRNEA